mmetsp:Transcript_38743/g.86166  ORF Transcript_38743/g.86166 Transcript_38743/m.86166 type:complete len:151 (+) Transcript_38743:206-658(+)
MKNNSCRAFQPCTKQCGLTNRTPGQLSSPVSTHRLSPFVTLSEHAINLSKPNNICLLVMGPIHAWLEQHVAPHVREPWGHHAHATAKTQGDAMCRPCAGHVQAMCRPCKVHVGMMPMQTLCHLRGNSMLVTAVPAPCEGCTGLQGFGANP